MSITLTLEQEKLIQGLLGSGRFRNAQEVIQAALHLLEAENRSHQAWLEQTRAKIDEAVEASKHTPPIDGETFVASLLERFQQAK